MDEEMKIKTVVEGRCKPEDVAQAGGNQLLTTEDAKLVSSSTNV